MNVLTLEPYYTGSHKAFLDGWHTNSRHHWTILTLPGYKWKWRMRHAAITFADEIQAHIQNGVTWDIIFCSDMLNVTEFYGLADKKLSALPSVVYFHENQLTYPSRYQQERDLHFAMTNFTTCLSATQVWFNSLYHQQTFLRQMASFIKQMPDFQPHREVLSLNEKSSVHYPGIEPFPPRRQRKPGSLHIVWAARWEYDKNPDLFFDAVKRLKDNNIDFRLSVLGEQFEDIPPIFNHAYDYFRSHIIHWGYLEPKSAYRQVLQDADVVVSTALHEFFGISIVEAIAAGAYPVVPKRLAYPELLPETKHDIFFYDGTPKGLADTLRKLSEQLTAYNSVWHTIPPLAEQFNTRYQWQNVSTDLDNALQQIVISKRFRA